MYIAPRSIPFPHFSVSNYPATKYLFLFPEGNYKKKCIQFSQYILFLLFIKFFWLRLQSAQVYMILNGRKMHFYRQPIIYVFQIFINLSNIVGVTIPIQTKIPLPIISASVSLGTFL